MVLEAGGFFFGQEGAEARHLGFTALACLSMPNLASAAATMETIGAEKCGGRVTAFKVEFLAPDGAALEATAKVLVRGAPSTGNQGWVTLVPRCF